MGFSHSKNIDYSKINFNEIEKFSFDGLEMPMYVFNVVDGDTIDVAFRVEKLKIGNYKMKNGISKMRIRLYGINTPEMKPRKDIPNRDEIIIQANKAKQRLEELILNKEVSVKCNKNDNFGRTLATIFVPIKNQNIDVSVNVNVNQLMINEGLAVKFMK